MNEEMSRLSLPDSPFVEYLKKVFNPLHNVARYSLKAEFYPSTTQTLFSPEVIQTYQVLPLGFKKGFFRFRRCQFLNIGFVDPPSQKAYIPELERLARLRLGAHAFDRLKIFRISSEDYLGVVKKFYASKGNQL